VLTPNFRGVVAEGIPAGLGGTYHGAQTMLRQCWARVFALVDLRTVPAESPRSPKASTGCAPPSSEPPPSRFLPHRLASACPHAAIPPARTLSEPMPRKEEGKFWAQRHRQRQLKIENRARRRYSRLP